MTSDSAAALPMKRFMTVLLLSVAATWPALAADRKSEPKSIPELQAAIEAVLKETRGRIAGPDGAAARLGMPASTLESKIKTLKINKHLFRGNP